MSTVHRCDRCGAEFGDVLPRLGMIPNPGLFGADLCSNCILALRKWIATRPFKSDEL